MYYAALLLLLLALIFGPQWWAQWTFRRYSRERDDIPGSGAELARHLLCRMAVDGIKVEQVTEGDHYDPKSGAVRLNGNNYSGHSLTAIAVAAHEVGHAIQHHHRERLFSLRTRLVRVAQLAQQIGAGLMFLIPLVTALTRIPQSGLLLFMIGIGSMGMASLVHLITLPVELDASFGKALPLLRHGSYVDERDEQAVRQILKAAALTYLAASLASLLNLARWIRFFRR